MTDLHQHLARLRRLYARYRRLLAAVLAAAAVAAVISALSPADPERTPVAVAAHDLHGGRTLTSTDVETVGMPPELVPGGSTHAADALVGTTLAAPM
ncbi:MAG: SAF domain-containing protein, partial [Nocardioidaceae bacterium]